VIIPAEDAISFPSKIYEFHENVVVQDLASNSKRTNDKD